MNLGQCSAVVSGGAGGLGAATSRRLVDLGVGVIVFDPDGDKAAAVAQELGERAVAVRGDQNNDADVAAAISAARNPFLNGQVIRLDGALSTPLTDMSPTGKP